MVKSGPSRPYDLTWKPSSAAAEEIWLANTGICDEKLDPPVRAGSTLADQRPPVFQGLWANPGHTSPAVAANAGARGLANREPVSSWAIQDFAAGAYAGYPCERS